MLLFSSMSSWDRQRTFGKSYPIMGHDRLATQSIFEIIKNQPGC